MTATTATGTTGTERSLAAVLLSRRGVVHLPPVAPGTRPATGDAVTLLETDLLDRGHLLSAGLRQALSLLDAPTLAAEGRALLRDVDHALGADVDHTPLFHGFPHTIPHDTLAFWVDRVLTLLFQSPHRPCVLCGTEGTVHAVDPCAHLVCRACFDGANFSACPVCHRRLAADEPFLLPKAPRPAGGAERALPDRMRVLTHGGGPDARDAAARDELAGLLARTGALSPQDGDDLDVLLAARDRTALDWLPAEVPGRETKARLLAWLLADPAAHPVTLPAAAALLTTATDVLRLLVVRSGGDAGLVDIPRFGPVPRPLRRALLSVLDGLDPELAAEDLRRHATAWKHAAERLHPFEHAARHPRAALAFAALRGFRLSDDRLSHLLRAAAERTPAAVAGKDGDVVTLPLWASRVESALAAGDVPAALPLLAGRPGELLRRLDHVLRLATGPGGGGPDAVLSALRPAAARVSPAVLLSALGELRTRGAGGRDRVFFPKGGTAKAHIVPDGRPALPADVVARTADLLTGEVLRRAGSLPPVDVAVVDTALDGVTAPFTERTASRALVTLPRGSELPVPDGRTLRLFLHWTESAASGRTDLDLSTAMYDASWRHVGTCDYTNLRFRESAAVHSGDLTSAPPPDGASEFVDLDLDKLAAAGVRHVVAVVFSFNSVPFEDLAEGFAGLMLRDEPGGTGRVFDPRQVEQRFDLTGPARACVPLLVDVTGRTMRWLDVVRGVTGDGHAVHRHADDLSLLGRGLTELFASGARVGIGELGRLQAAARARVVVLRRPDGSSVTYRRRVGEGVAAFARRIGTSDADAAVDGAGAGLAFLYRGDLELARGAEVFALHPREIDAGAVRLLTASDVVAALA
ncbi:MXAN_6230/SCO0854 family RING domain-containing protein [Streptomyces sp. I05A-00742]|uniref:MXAN_6230/SCO0854 family RING domain-containing protein n=1 Tax=Streptomyces sp. I05A-00742 TaxID=2732853 RepID=UPI0014888F59|nr:MXAN_6230/SCO0854 family RING domain-containing protein [Streptomyces sp. I05A-00742]